MLPSNFDRDGYVVLQDALPPRHLRTLRRALAAVARHACQSSSTADDHNSVLPPEDTAAFQFEHNSDGSVRTPMRVHKVQGVGLVCPDVQQAIRSQAILSTAAALASEERLDAFGTKYFPVEPGSAGSVGWHDDNYYFGTTRSRTISCVCYLADTRRANGCLRIVPGSHRDARVGPERAPLYSHDAQRHGEYISEATMRTLVGDDREAPAPKRRKAPREAVDVEVPAGSAVLFDANLLHATHSNRSANEASPRLAFHFIPADHAGEFRGVSFARGKFRDRHPTATC